MANDRGMAFGQLSYAVRETESLTEIGEIEITFQVVLIDHPPSRVELAAQGVEGLPL